MELGPGSTCIAVGRRLAAAAFTLLALACGGGGGTGSTPPPPTTYTVTYSGNGSTGGSVPTDSGAYGQGATVTVLGNSGSLVKSGSSFTGWNTVAGGTGFAYTAGQTFTIGAANVTLYAQWSAGPAYSVTYNGNGNTGGSVPVDPATYQQGQTFLVLGNTGSLVKTGNSFSGWNTAAGGTGTAYTAGQTVTMGSANVTLYAQWAAGPATYTVTYNGNGSTGGSVPGDFNTYQQGQTVTVLGNIGNLVKTGVSFLGWNTAANGTGTTYTAGQTFTMGTANVTLYALWPASTTLGHAYVVNQYDAPGTVSQLTMASTGVLTALTPATVNCEYDPNSLAVDPTGKFLYAVNLKGGASNTGGSISQFTIDPTTRALTAMTPAVVAAGVSCTDIAVHPTGPWAYAPSAKNPGAVMVQFTIGANGALTQTSSTAPITAPFTEFLAIHPSGKYLYLVTQGIGFGNIDQYTIDPTTGALTAMTPAFVTPPGSGTTFAITIHPSGKYAYVTDYGGAIYEYTIDPNNGSLSLLGQTTVAGAVQYAAWITVDPSGKYAYVANPGNAAAAISQYTVGANGILAAMSPASVAATSAATNVQVDATGKYVYITGGTSGSFVSQFAIGPTGTLTLEPWTVYVGSGPNAIVLVQP